MKKLKVKRQKLVSFLFLKQRVTHLTLLHKLQPELVFTMNKQALYDEPRC